MSVNNWFKDVTGFYESEWDFCEESLPKHIQKNMGKFDEISIMELKKLTQEYKINDIIPKLNVHIRNDYDHEECFDTSALQFNGPDNAMYQVASNFNCIEVASEYVNPFSGKYLTRLMSDSTQGPSASGGAGYGAILRLLMHKKIPINLLSDTQLKPINGKLRYFDLKDHINNDLIKIGLHTGVRATYLRTSNNFEYNPKGPIIDQVFTSTCICSNNKPNKLSEILLQSAYDGTYLAAVYRQTPKLVLTLIGGNMFMNSLQQIATAIANSHKKYAKYLNPKCEVVIPLYSKSEFFLESLNKEIDINVTTI